MFQSPVNLRTLASAFLSGPVAPQSTHIAKYRSPFTILSEPQKGHGFAFSRRAVEPVAGGDGMGAFSLSIESLVGGGRRLPRLSAIVRHRQRLHVAEQSALIQNRGFMPSSFGVEFI